MAKHKYIKTPQELERLFFEYIESNKQDPYLEQQWVGKDGDEVHKKIMKHISFDGFEGWLCERMIITDLAQYSSNRDGRYDEYVPIITRIKRICRGKLLTAAVSGVANGNVVARYLGLVEKSQQEVTIQPLFPD